MGIRYQSLKRLYPKMWVKKPSQDPYGQDNKYSDIKYQNLNIKITNQKLKRKA